MVIDAPYASTDPRSARSTRSHQQELRRASGAVAFRISDAAGAGIREHSHDWPVLSLYVSGGLTNVTAVGETALCGPSAVLYGAGAAHANLVGAQGFEQIQIEFDPAWLRLNQPLDLAGPHHWIGGKVGFAARDLATRWMRLQTPDAELIRATSSFLIGAFRCPTTVTPAWLGHVSDKLAAEKPPSTAELATELGLNRHWLRQAYRAAVGEGMGETVRRRKVEAAITLLRSTTLPAAEIAAAAGFSDQSHMIRCFTAVVGCSPRHVRRAWSMR
jgi:AraC family transcriptional regulator